MNDHFQVREQLPSMEWEGLRAKRDSDGKINAEGENKGSAELGQMEQTLVKVLKRVMSLVLLKVFSYVLGLILKVDRAGIVKMLN